MGYKGLYREAHSDLSDETFCAQALNDLEAAMGLAGDNWTHTLLLAIIITLTLRIHNFVQHEHLKLHAVNILSQARRTAFEWILTLQALVANQKQKQPQLRHALLGASLVLRATFDLESKEITSFDTGEDGIARYIFAGTFLTDPTLDSLPVGIRFLAQHDRRAALRLQPHVAIHCAVNPTILHVAVSFRWSTFDLKGSGWRQLATPAERWWSFTTPENSERMQRVVHLNLLDGSFLIDGASFDHLPNEITKHMTYKELFHNNDIENVCPSTIRGMSYEGYYQGHQVHLTLKGEELIIRHYEHGHIEEFIPSSILKGDLPYTLVHGSHHWYMEDSNSLEIRSQDQTWLKKEPRVWTAALRRKSRALLGNVTRNVTSTTYHLVDPHSPLYDHLLTRLQPLETRKDAGAYGHPLTSIKLQNAGGYFTYDVDNLLGRLHVMETTHWHPVLPTLSQDPNFLPIVEAILDHWQRLDKFHSIGQNLATRPHPPGMNHLSARANVRNWIFHSSAYSIPTLEDVAYKHRDCIHEQESKERERLTFQVAALSNPFTTKFPYTVSLADTVQGWGRVEAPKDWSCDDVPLWMSAEIAMSEL
ncbi:789_t:CDS:2, partial [Acaulospora colombiana]